MSVPAGVRFPDECLISKDRPCKKSIYLKKYNIWARTQFPFLSLIVISKETALVLLLVAPCLCLIEFMCACVLGWRHQSCLSDGGTCRCVSGSKTRRRRIISSESHKRAPTFFLYRYLFSPQIQHSLNGSSLSKTKEWCHLSRCPIGFFCCNKVMMSSLPLSNRMSLSRCCNAPSFLFTTKRNTPSGTKLRYEVDTSGLLHISPEIFKMFPDVSESSVKSHLQCLSLTILLKCIADSYWKFNHHFELPNWNLNPIRNFLIT